MIVLYLIFFFACGALENFHFSPYRTHLLQYFAERVQVSLHFMPIVRANSSWYYDDFCDLAGVVGSVRAVI